MAKHIDIRKYKLDPNEIREIKLDGNKIIKYFAKQVYADHYSSREEPSGTEYYDWFDGCEEILDIGAGMGSSLNELKNRGKKVMGITCNPIEKLLHGVNYRFYTVEEALFHLSYVDAFLNRITCNT